MSFSALQELLLRLNPILAAYYKQMAEAIAKGSADTYAKAAMAADRSIGIKFSVSAYSEAAERYAQTYAKEIIEKGGTTVYDPKSGGRVFKPWLAEQEKAAREEIADIVRQGIKEGKPTKQVAKELTEKFDGDAVKAKMVARTETRRIQSTGRLEQWKARGVTHVRVRDDEGPNSCAACRRVNGMVWDIDYAMEHELEHPNCVRVFTAIYVRGREMKGDWQSLLNLREGEELMTPCET